VAARSNDKLLRLLSAKRLRACAKARTNQRTVGAEHQGCRQTATVADAAGCHHGCWSYRIDHRRHQRQRGATAPMTSGLGALGDNHVGPCFLSQPCSFKVLHLANHFATCRLDRLTVGTRIAEREHECIGVITESQI
jgi:hypothetical protein